MFHALFPETFLAPPVGETARYPLVPLVLSALFAVFALIAGVIYTRKTKSPLFFWSAVSGVALYPFFVEPIGDHFVAVWYPDNHYIAATMFDRPMPWFAVLFYAAGIPVATVVAYEIARRGLPARMLLGLVLVLTVLELPAEVLGNHFHWMVYYGNHATILNLPIYCIPQNGGMFAVVAWVLAWLLPHVRGWRWVVVPFALAATLPVFALVTTFPAYIAIAAGAGPLVGWSAGILAAVLNAAVVVACIYSPALQRFRRSATDRSPITQPA